VKTVTKTASPAVTAETSAASATHIRVRRRLTAPVVLIVRAALAIQMVA